MREVVTLKPDSASVAWLHATRIHYSPNSPLKLLPNFLAIAFKKDKKHRSRKSWLQATRLLLLISMTSISTYTYLY
jgi:hypothetical protein